MLMMIKRSNRGKLSGSLGGRAIPDTRKGTQRKRSLWSLITAAVAIALVGLFTVGTGVSYADTQDAATQDLSEPVHHKTIEQHLVNGKWDGTYDLKLTVQGDSVGSTETNPVDIVVVLDTSGSMNDPYDGKEDSPSKLTMAKNALTNIDNTGLLDKVLGSDGPDGVKVSLVTFGTYAQTVYASTDNPWYDRNNAQALKNSVNGIEAYDGTGTNWEAALDEAKSLLDSDTSDGVQKYVVFLSDGNPTFRVTSRIGYEREEMYRYEWRTDEWGIPYLVKVSDGYKYTPVADPDQIGFNDIPKNVHGNGREEYATWSGYDKVGNKQEYNWNYSCAADVAKSFGMDSKHFFSVKIATEAEKMDSLESYATNSSASALDGTNPKNLSDAFDGIVTEITHSQTYTNVTIKDTLSPYAEIVTTPTVSKTGTENNVLPAGNVASVSDDRSTVTWAIQENGTKDLEAGATYTLTINVRPNQRAYDRAMTGDYDTGITDAGTEGKGIFSNDNENTSLSYSTVKYTNGEATGEPVPHASLAYDKPVMEIPLSSITVKKVWEPETSALDSATVKLQWWNNAEGKWEDVKDVKDPNVTRTLVLNKNNGWTGTFDKIAAGPEGHKYQVVEEAPSDDPNAWTTTYKYTLGNNSYYSYEENRSGVTEKSDTDEGFVTLAGRQAQTANAKVTNKQHTLTLTITKTVGGNFGDRSQSFGFTLNLKDASGKAITNAATTENGLTGGTDGKYTFALKNGKSVSITVPYGTSYTVVEDDLNHGISSSDPDYYNTTVAVKKGGSGIVSNEERKASSEKMTANTTVDYTNSRTVDPDVGVDLGSGAPYAAVFGGVGIAGAIWMVLKRRNSLGI